MPTPRQVIALGLYADLMGEVKIRLACIETATRGLSGIPGAVTREFCFLQIRMLCELIALSCLTAHGDIKEATRLRDEYSAGKIIGQLEKLHPLFYPWPVHVKSAPPQSGVQHEMEGIKDGFLTKDELLRLYGKCGDILHRGTMKKLLSDRMPVQTNFPDILQTVARIKTFLNEHGIMLLDEKTIMLCVLNDASNNNNVQVAIAEAVEHQPNLGFKPT